MKTTHQLKAFMHTAATQRQVFQRTAIGFGCGNDTGPKLPNTTLTGFDYFRTQLIRDNRAEGRAYLKKALASLAQLPLAPFVVVPQLLRSTEVGRTHPAPPADPQRMRAHVAELVQHDRSFLNTAGLDASAAYIHKTWAAQGYTVTEQPFDTPKGRFKNLIVSYGPADAPRIVVGAHYDVCITEVPDGRFKPGADDNASGVSVLLELSRLLKTHQPTLPYRIEMVAYANEEPPFFRSRFMGSAVHADSLKVQGADVKAMFALDTLGYYSDAPGSQKLPPLANLIYPDTGNFLALAAELNSLHLVRKAKKGIMQHSAVPVYGITAPSFVPGVDYSDHINYTRYGWPGVMVTDTAMSRNPNYHHATDTIDTLNFEKMAQVAQGLYGLITNF
jgi:Zn-dependent M28 family amino/carboxypeptidase